MKIAVVGSINTDQVVIADKIPLKGETIFGSSINYIPGGKGANQAVAMAKLGADVTMFGCVGDDSNGEMVLANLKKYNINTDNIKIVKGVPSGIAIITLGNNDNSIVVIKGANDCIDKNYIDSIKNQLLSYDLVLLQLEMPIETVEYVIDLCNENKVRVVLNPAPANKLPKGIIDKVDYVTPNEHEYKMLFEEDIDLESALKSYPNKLIVTLGEEGVGFASDKDTVIKVPIRKTTVVDTTGAGDTLNGALCVRICAGDTLWDAIRYANVAASLSIEKLGAQGGMPTHQEVLNALKV